MPSLPALRRLSSDFKVRLAGKGKAIGRDADAQPQRWQAPAQSRAQQQTGLPTPPEYSELGIPPLEHCDSLQTSQRFHDSWIHAPSTEDPPPRYEPAQHQLPSRARRPLPMARPSSHTISAVSASQGQSTGDAGPSQSQPNPVATPTLARARVESIMATVPMHIWAKIAEYCTPETAASLAIANRALAASIGPEHFANLNLSPNKGHKIEFMKHMDGKFPDHVLCFTCAQYHLRSKEHEGISSSWRTKQLYTCPLLSISRPAPRLRLTSDRELPFTLVQLAKRHQTISPHHGIPLKTLSRTWTDPYSDWTHRTRFMVLDNHLLMRVKSSVPVRGGLMPSEMRLLLLERGDYTPYFSVCHHWTAEGALTSLCKCAMRHIPAGPVSNIASSCAECRPLRRCFHCPTEYAIQVRLEEDKEPGVKARFRYVLHVTRWSDLGECRDPYKSLEWMAVAGQGEYHPMQRSGDLDGLGTLRYRFESRLGVRVVQARALPLRAKEKWKSTNQRLWTEQEKWLHAEQHRAGPSSVLGGGRRVT